ncbi:MAG: hypothetical protein HYS05_15710 [Acidobacteria bacterium]|nr:hypothetical protein [Acidobacteriota bacterium]
MIDAAANRLQPALLGGVFLGVLSALPFINLANCCCLWWLGGGAVAAYLLQANTPRPVTAGDGAVVGLMAGVVGAFVWAVVSIPVDLIMGPFQRALFNRMLSTTADMPGPARAILENVGAGAGIIVSIVIGFVFMLIMGTIFTTFGGVLGAVLFQKKPAPPTEPPPGL